MDAKLQSKLEKKYPKILKGVWCECGSGWYQLLDLLCKQLQWDTDHNKYPQLEAMQVKEKYGTLRFYTNGTNDKQDGIIRFAEIMSWYICEHCGSNDRVTQSKGWIVTLCHKCMRKRNDKNISE